MIQRFSEDQIHGIHEIHDNGRQDLYFRACEGRLLLLLVLIKIL
jgi:hypothetical protein